MQTMLERSDGINHEVMKLIPWDQIRLYDLKKEKIKEA